MQARKGGAWRTITSGQAFSNGAWRQISNGKCFKGGLWRDVCNFTATPTTGAMTLTVSPSSSSTSSVGPAVVSAAITATPSGGLSPYKYTWNVTSLSGHVFTLTSPTSATTAVQATLGSGDIAVCTITCVCADSTTLSAASAAVRVTLICTGGIIP